MKLHVKKSSNEYEITFLFCCEQCGRPMRGTCANVWTEDENGEVQNATFVHWLCKDLFESEHDRTGKWLSRAVQAVELCWSAYPLMFGRKHWHWRLPLEERHPIEIET
jgi:hypothetical protein